MKQKHIFMIDVSNVNYNIFNCYNGNITRIIIMKKRKTIKLPIDNMIIELSINDDGEWGGTITSDWKEKCPGCDEFYCISEVCCGLSEDIEDKVSRNTFNSCIDAIEAVILAHACAGIDVKSPAYLEGIETAQYAISNNGMI